MTREEAIRNLKRLVGFSPKYDEAISTLFPDKQPQLPSDVEEAAEMWCKENCKGFVLKDKSARYVGDGIDAFKAGAEYERGKGETVEGILLNSQGYPSEVVLNTYLSQYDDREKVIVQIRKRKEKE